MSMGFPYEQRISPPRSAAQQYWLGAYPSPPPRNVPSHLCIYVIFCWEDLMSKTRVIMLSLLACVVVSGCNTVKGAGRDIESVGNKAEEVIN